MLNRFIARLFELLGSAYSRKTILYNIYYYVIITRPGHENQITGRISLPPWSKLNQSFTVVSNYDI